MPRGGRQKLRVADYDPNIVLEKDVLPIFKRYKDGHVHTIIGVEDMYQACRVCGELKNEKEFNIHSQVDKYSRRVLNNSCRDCQHKKDRLLNKLKKENGPPATHCQLCGKEGGIVLDHCHMTEKFRGWLCQSCNIGLGKLKDSIEMLQKGIKYLKGESNE